MNKKNSNIPFIGRQKELDELRFLLTKKSASLVVITGRRRIGKSRLILEFAKNFKCYSFTGIPPTRKVTAKMQRDEFAKQFGNQFGLSSVEAGDWSDLFVLLARETHSGKVIILFDEISWMGSKDPSFLGKLKNAWDMHFSKNPNLILVLCGSVSSWVEKNIVSSTAFFGRISLKIVLNELTLQESYAFIKKVGVHGSIYDIFILLAIVGGVPWYLELISSELPVAENIKRLCFTPHGILVDEFKRIFNDLFDKRSSIYQKIVACLAKGSAEYGDLAEALSYSSSGALSAYLEDLVVSGFISRDYTWSFVTGDVGKNSSYRLCDNYLRFYLRYIASNVMKIQKGQMRDISLMSLPAWDTMMGLQFENLVINNRELLYQALNIKPEDVVADNPYFQRKNTKQNGCQIDYLIQTRFNNLYVCEIKFTRTEVRAEVVKEVEQKIHNLKCPKNFAKIPVLIHAGNLAESIYEKNYFAKIIDFGEYLADV